MYNDRMEKHGPPLALGGDENTIFYKAREATLCINASRIVAAEKRTHYTAMMPAPQVEVLSDISTSSQTFLEEAPSSFELFQLNPPTSSSTAVSDMPCYRG